MELVAAVHLWLRVGILSPAKGALEARAAAAGGGLDDDLAPPDALMNCPLWLNQMLPENPRYLTDEVPPDNRHCTCTYPLPFSAVLLWNSNGLIVLFFCSIGGVPYPVAGAVPLSFPWFMVGMSFYSLYTVDSVLEVFQKG
jgi:hypothetical protein